MRLYLAGSWAEKRLMHAAHDYMRAQGFEVVSTWTEQPDDAEQTATPEFLRYCAERDWAELCAADTLIYCNFNGGTKSGGKATELGGALMAGKRCILVGAKAHNIFLHLPQVLQFNALGFAVQYLRTLDAPR